VPTYPVTVRGYDVYVTLPPTGTGEQNNGTNV